MSEPAPLWFVVLGTIVLVLCLFKNILFGFISDIWAVLRGKMSCLGCLFTTVFMIFAAGLVIWCLITDLF